MKLLITSSTVPSVADLVAEEFISSIFWSDEAKALGGVEPLYGSLVPADITVS